MVSIIQFEDCSLNNLKCFVSDVPILTLQRQLITSAWRVFSFCLPASITIVVAVATATRMIDCMVFGSPLLALTAVRLINLACSLSSL